MYTYEHSHNIKRKAPHIANRRLCHRRQKEEAQIRLGKEGNYLTFRRNSCDSDRRRSVT